MSSVTDNDNDSVFADPLTHDTDGGSKTDGSIEDCELSNEESRVNCVDGQRAVFHRAPLESEV